MSQQLPSITLKTSTAQMALSLLESGNYHQALQVFRQVPDSDRTLDDGSTKPSVSCTLTNPKLRYKSATRPLS
jgi:hypothetical protein